jgi:GTP-binding protein Era
MKGAASAAHRAGYVAIVGRPNVGKSTLLNICVGQKISIVSRKAQTTRHRITGILSRPDAQFVFVDTPGFQTEHGGALNRLMNRNVTQALHEVDAAIWMVEAGRYGPRDAAVLKQIPEGVATVLAINKIDRMHDRQRLLPFLQQMSALAGFAAMVPISAATGDGIAPLLDEVAKLLPAGDVIFGEDEITDRSERFLAAEMLREKLFRQLGEELPYSATVVIDTFSEQPGIRHIGATIMVDRAGHKPIIIGRGGETLKRIAADARRDMERLFDSKVFLEVWVKVKSGWADNAAQLKALGYD